MLLKNKIILALSLCALHSSAWSAEITVAAAASLTNAFQVISKNFEKKYPNTKVNLTFASSGTLLQQLRNGAPIDVLATADQQTMNDAQSSALIQNKTRVNFSSNKLVLIAPRNSTLKIKSLNDLTQANIKHIALGNPAHTPAGRYAQASLEKQKLWHPIQDKLIKTQNVRHALDYVARGETEVGFVFSSDVLSQPDKVKVIMNVATTEAITYPIAVTAKTTVSKDAQSFIQYVKSDAAQQTLQQYGFLK